ncbi:carbohydrate-binding protein, partial [bacterium]|nr:carbohydrate-binding protein [bacterium]
IHEVNIRGLKSADGTSLANSYLAYTLNRLLENTPPDPLHVSGKASPKSAPQGKPVKVIDPIGTVYQAEDAKRRGVGLATGHGGFTGRNYADFGEGEQSIEWTVKSAKTGQGKILVRYALGASKRPLKLIVNGKDAGILPFPPTGDWKKWGDLTSPVTLKKGENKIVLRTNGASGGNIDHLQVVGP